jgi:hypothetical protein
VHAHRYLRRVLRVQAAVGLSFAAVVVIAAAADGWADEPSRSARRAAPIVKVPCDAGSIGTGAVVQTRDVVIGPVVLLGARRTTWHRPDAFNDHGYKVPVTLPEGVTATLSVPKRLKGRVGLVFSHATQDRVARYGARMADSAVRFSACQPNGEPGRTGWPGGLAVDRRRCATLVVKVAGEPAVSRRVPLGRRC